MLCNLSSHIHAAGTLRLEINSPVTGFPYPRPSSSILGVVGVLGFDGWGDKLSFYVQWVTAKHRTNVLGYPGRSKKALYLLQMN